MSAPHPKLAEAQALHQQILQALRAHRIAELTLARLLRRAFDERSYFHLGFGSFRDYARLALDLERGKAHDLLKLGQRLPDLLQLEAAMERGELGWTKAREVARVATAETESAWLSRAREVTSRVLEHEVRQVQTGELPPDGPPEVPVGPARRRIVVEMEAQEAEVFKQAMRVLWARLSHGADEIEEGAIVADLARKALLAEEEPATAERYTVVLEHCPECGKTEGHGAEVRETLRQEAACDAQVLEMRTGPEQGTRTRAIPPRIRRQVLARDKRRCLVPGCTNALWLDLHHMVPWSHGGSHEPANLVAICSLHHRQHHEGYLGIEPLGDRRVRFSFAEGRAYTLRLGVDEIEGWLAHLDVGTLARAGPSS